MKNKNAYIAIIIRSFIIFIFLLVILYKNQDLISRMMLFPFLLCSLFIIGKNICLLMDKKRASVLFSKLFASSFFLFWFGMLTYGCIYFIKSKNYFSVLFTIPFWISGIYMVRKIFLTDSKKIEKQKSPKFNFQIVVSSILVFSVLGIGFLCLFFGIRDTYKFHVKTRGYLTTEGYFDNYSIYNTSKDKTTYKLIYVYKVDGDEYTIATDYGVGAEFIPEMNSKRKVKYNANNPKEAVLSGTNKGNFLIYFGAFFTLVGGVFVLFVLSIKGVFDKVKFDIIGTYIGVVCIILGIGIILFQVGTASSLLDAVKSLGIWILIPILFLISVIYLTIKSLFFQQKINKKRE